MFLSVDTYQGQISDAAAAWSGSASAHRDEKDLLASHPVAREIAVYDQKIADLQRDIRHLDEEDLKVQGRIHHNERERSDAAKIIEDEMHELTGGDDLC